MKKTIKIKPFISLLIKPDLKMKLTYILLFVSLFQVKAGSYAQNVKVNLDVENGNYQTVFQEIEKQTDFRFFYSDEDLDWNREVNISAKKEHLGSVLKRLFKNSGNKFQIMDEQIVVLKKKPLKVSETQSSERQQKYEVTGTVTDMEGIPLYGVAVIDVATSFGTGTDIDGNFTLEVDDLEQTLEFSYLGFKTQTIELEGRDELNVKLKDDLSELDQVVLIGYGKQSKEDVTGAVSSIDKKDIENLSTGTVGFDRALGGLAKGVQVSQNTGRPGAPIRMNIRGYTSPLSGSLNQPLYVIDGVPFNVDALPNTYGGGGNNPLLAISSDNIESVDVLKDAAATSIYGSRGANGVVIVKTKNGKRDQKPTVNFSYSTTFSEPIGTLKSLNTKQYKDYYGMLIGNSVPAVNNGRIPGYLGYDLMNFGNITENDDFSLSYNGLNQEQFGNEDVNWNDEVYRDLAITDQVDFGISGGTEKTNYSFGVSMTDQEGLVVHDKFKQYNTRVAINTDINDYITAGTSMNLGYTQSESGEGGIISQFNVNTGNIMARPDIAVRDENGTLKPQPDYQYGFETYEPNPLSRLSNDNQTKNYNFLGNGFVEIEPIKDLKLKAELNGAFFENRNSVFTPKTTQTNFGAPNESYLDRNGTTSTNVTTNLTANYDFHIKAHRFQALAGYSWDRTQIEGTSYFFRGFPDDDVLTNVGSAEEVQGFNSSDDEKGINSFFSRLNYNYKNRYNATVNFRTDASSKFGPENKRAYFPSVSASWNIAKEEFLAENNTVNELKIRASVGKVGSANVTDFSYLQFFSTGSNDVYNGSTAILASNTLPNPYIGWETTKEINLGLDFEFFKKRLHGSVDVYNRKTTGALAPTPIPLELGPDVYYSNLMDVSNKGVEIAIGGDIIKSGDFFWSIDANWAFNRNNLDRLHGANINSSDLDYYIEGEPVGTIKGYKVTKILQNQEEVDALNNNSPTGQYDRASLGVGDYQYEDTNGDGKITTDDRVKIGSVEPDFFGGFNSNWTYKNFSLSAYFQYSVGGESVWDALTNQPAAYLGPNKLSAYANNTWTPDNRDARFAKAIYTDPSDNSRVSDRYVYSNSYLRLKYLQLNYNIDRSILDKLKVQQASIFISASNLFTVSNWPGIDPEAFSERGTITDQVNNEDPYPLAKSFSVGLKLQF